MSAGIFDTWYVPRVYRKSIECNIPPENHSPTWLARDIYLSTVTTTQNLILERGTEDE